MPTIGVFLSFYLSLCKSFLGLVFGRFYKPQHVSTRDLTGQTAIVTGANSGIGFSIAVALAKQGANVCLACRNSDRGTAAVERLVSLCGEIHQEQVSCQILDVGDLASVRDFCQRWTRQGKKIDMLVHNAGIASPPVGSPSKTKEGLDIMYSTNFLGSFLMTHLLEDSLSPAARVVMTSSVGSYSATAHFLYGASRKTEKSTPGVVARIVTKVKAVLGIEAEGSAPAYGLSKAQQVLFADLLQQHFNRSPEYNRTAHSFSPGFTSTPIFSKYDVTWQTWISNPNFALLKVTEKWVGVDTDEGAKTGTWLATWGAEMGKKKQGGAYWERMDKRTSLVALMNKDQKQDEWNRWEKDASALWEI